MNNFGNDRSFKLKILYAECIRNGEYNVQPKLCVYIVIVYMFLDSGDINQSVWRAGVTEYH